MPENRGYLPEGLSAPPLYTLEMLRRAVSDDTVLEGTVQRCDGDLNLYLQLGSTFAKIPREEVTAPWISGADREIAVLSRVGKQVCFTVESLSADAKGAPQAVLSRRKAQEAAMEEMLRELKSGSVVAGRVVRTEPFCPRSTFPPPASAIPTSGSGWGRKFWQWSRSLTGKTGGSP